MNILNNVHWAKELKYIYRKKVLELRVNNDLIFVLFLHIYT